MKKQFLKRYVFQSSKVDHFKSVISLLPFNAIERKNRVLSKLLIYIFNVLPAEFLILIFPKFFHALIANYFLSVGEFRKFHYFIKSSQEYRPSHKFSFSMRLDALRDQCLFDDIDELIESVFNAESINDGSFDAVISWCFWNLSHIKLEHFLTNLKRFLESDLDSSFELVRYLPDFSRNLGHLSCLYLYENYYRSQAGREIFIKNEGAVNKYYLDMLIDHSKLKINLIKPSQFPDKNIKSIRSFDTLLYSFESENSVRIESDASNSFVQLYPEWFLANRNPLRMSNSEISKGHQMLNNIIGNKWFVLLHVREPSDSILANSQARDSNIHTYKLLADYIHNKGGLVIRMGQSNLPALASDFHAFDYARSKIKSEFLDCWLWANCKYWVGNVNGAMLTALTFGKARLITNQWYWNLYGGPEDLVLPKLLFRNEALLSIDETMKCDLSRQMNRRYMENQGFNLSENTEQEILDGFIDLERNIPLASISNLDVELRKRLKINNANRGIMRISPSYSISWGEKLTSIKN
jgi:putative glycosyltransferase (TIGR04372 family)